MSMMLSVRNGPKAKGCDWLNKSNERVGNHCDKVEMKQDCP